MRHVEPKRVDVAGITLVWGEPSRAKAMLRAESEKRFRELPAAERLRLTLSMIRRDPGRKSGRR